MLTKEPRTICLFSCGAASAVATKLVLREITANVEIHYREVMEEHPDNKRFLQDCQAWFGKNITVLRNEKYNASIYEVFYKNKFIKNRFGAPCTRLLKKELGELHLQPTDTIILGYTYEEQGRLDRFIDANPTRSVRAPLIEQQITKSDCLGILVQANIEIPTMYKLGYKNNNCIGCVKGGMGYWNKIRIDFPETFEKMSALEQLLGEGAYLFREKDGTRLCLKDLPPGRGHYPKEPSISCGVTCEALDE